MGLIGLIASSLLPPSENSGRYNGRTSGGCCTRPVQSIQPAHVTHPPQQQLMAPNMDYMYMTNGRPSCHQRKMERRVQRKLQRAERDMLRAEQRTERDFQRAQRHEAGVMLVKAGMQKVGVVGRRSENSSNGHEMRNVNMNMNTYETRDNVFETDNVNQQQQQQHSYGVQRDAPPAYQEVEKK
ncbi:hypothetical protein FALBO_10949 [Fusarium albosuccineum]|uniref:Uncharacterized protein n=1 Tax=Fusarium albosuccineum TaxID=1237068 RepID=A0A8H4L6U1_9HYPO|nr:hypothetical protein FALBO_10949 [Fusarium albosuccineum]